MAKTPRPESNTDAESDLAGLIEAILSSMLAVEDFVRLIGGRGDAGGGDG